LNASAELTCAAPLDAWTSWYTARNGMRICIRPLRSDDRLREVAFIESLSAQARYFRFMSPLRFLPKHLLDQLMTIDYVHSMAFAATIDAGSAERFVGLARYGVTDNPEVAEIAITVTDDWQRQGIARALLEQLVRYASAHGYRELIGWVLHENGAMLSLARACGFQVRIAVHHGAMEIHRVL
jgi:GNAT superfamily N-acetyltransferase